MHEAFTRLREPIAWFVVVTGAAYVVLAAISWADFRSGTHGTISVTSVPMAHVVLIVGAVLACALIRPATLRVTAVAAAAALVVSVAAVLDLVTGDIGALWSSDGVQGVISALWLVVDLLVKAVAAALLWTLVARAPGLGAVPAAATGRAENRPRGDHTLAQQQPADALPASIEPERRPVWAPHEAAGASWTRAGDAASGANAAVWGTGDEPRGGAWQPAATPDAAPDPDRAIEGEPRKPPVWRPAIRD